jgi:hypothetical protein
MDGITVEFKVRHLNFLPYKCWSICKVSKERDIKGDGVSACSKAHVVSNKVFSR